MKKSNLEQKITIVRNLEKKTGGPKATIHNAAIHAVCEAALNWLIHQRLNEGNP